MAHKIINATEAKTGTSIIIEGEPCVVKSIDISKTGKHGHAKARIEAVGLLDGKKRVIARPGHERFEVPLIEKRKGQVLSVSNNNINMMDIESFETIDLPYPKDFEDEITDGDQIEYWDIEGIKTIRRKI
jgi:translation initiation factor 5A